MDFELALRSIYALAVVGLLLLALWWAVRQLNRGRLVALTGSRLVSVVESTYVAQNTSLHVVKVGENFYLIGGGAGHLTLLAELPSDRVQPYIDSHKRALDQQAQTLGNILAGLRRK